MTHDMPHMAHVAHLALLPAGLPKAEKPVYVLVRTCTLSVSTARHHGRTPSDTGHHDNHANHAINRFAWHCMWLHDVFFCNSCFRKRVLNA